MRRGPMAVVLLLAGVAAAGADWLGWLGSREALVRDVLRVRLRTVDAVSGDPVSAVHVACTRSSPLPGHGSAEACTDTGTGGRGEVDLAVGVLRRLERTRLFEHDRGISLGAGAELHVMFIHPGHARTVRSFDADQLAALRGSPMTVPLPRAVDDAGAGE